MPATGHTVPAPLARVYTDVCWYLLPINPRLCRLVSLFLLTIALAACSGSDSSLGQAQNDDISLSFSLTSATSGTEKAMTNLTDGGQQWLSWAGDTAAVYYDWNTGAVRIPADGQDVVSAVQRYDQPLEQGTTYTLNVQSDDMQAGAILFLFDWNGAIVKVGGRNLEMATTGQPIAFQSPANVAGFYVQVQSSWRAANDAQIAAQTDR